MTSPPTSPPAIACDLDALGIEGRARRASLAAALGAATEEVRELPDGYAMRLDGSDARAREALDWLLLERACCPFLRLEIDLEPAAGPLWLRFRGAPAVKEFLASAGFGSRSGSSGQRRS
ncbi:MAG TPA: hypothetical protein VMW35_04940 [Myxococcota bacterium]|jgi:hypothetical protein|nr:hypothetical protein [Myxococcota bacterium]